MKRPEEGTLRELCDSHGLTPENLVFLGGGREDSDGIVYRAGQKVFKVLSYNIANENALPELFERLAFVRYLGENGVRISYPIPNERGELYALAREESTQFAAYVMPLVSGANPGSDYLASENALPLYKAWGAQTGRIHRLTRDYPVWKKLECGVSEYGYIDEVHFFINWCEDERGKTDWRDLMKRLDLMPKSRANYGFIHNDNHQMNILANGSELTLIDFDCAGCNFFLQDFVTPLQGIMFDMTGGMITGVTKPDILKRAFTTFAEGYETERHIENGFFNDLDTFVEYRRLLLFTCLQGFLNSKPELKTSMLETIEKRVPIFG